MYVSRGFLELVHFPLSGDQPNEKYSQKLYFMKNFDSHIRHEKIAHHDCFYKNIYDYEYISPIGKVTVPQIIYLYQCQVLMRAAQTTIVNRLQNVFYLRSKAVKKCPVSI